MQKRGIKTPPIGRINIAADPGLHLSRTRVCVVGTPRSQAALKAIFDKKKPILMKKEAVLTYFAPVSGRSLFLSYD